MYFPGDPETQVRWAIRQFAEAVWLEAVLQLGRYKTRNAVKSARCSPCSFCAEPMECDWVDVGVGEVQCGPYHCENCDASQIGPEGTKELLSTLTEVERKSSFYAGWRGRISPLANTVGGQLVDHRTALRLYEMGLLDEKDPDGGSERNH